VSILFFEETEESIKPQIARISPLQPDRRFKFHKRSQFFIRTHNEPPSVAAMRVRNPDRSPLGIHG
jgi:hypothetical protein